MRNTRERLAHLFGADHALTLTVTADRAIAELDAPFVPPIGAEPRAATRSPTSSPPSSIRRSWRRRSHGCGALSDRIHPAIAIVGFWTLAWLFWVFQIHVYRVARAASTPDLVEWSLPDLVSAHLVDGDDAGGALSRGGVSRSERSDRSPAIAVHVVGALGATAVNIGAIFQVFGLSKCR